VTPDSTATTADQPPRLAPSPAEVDLDAVNAELAGRGAEDVVRWAVDQYPGRVAMTSSFGAQSAVMLHLVTRIAPELPVIVIDTGYLFPETYRFMEALRDRLGLRLHIYQPAITPARQEALYGKLWEQGEQGLKRYHTINKVEPMQRALRELDVHAWLAGLRKSQTDYRAGLRFVESQNGIAKVHPIVSVKRGQTSTVNIRAEREFPVDEVVALHQRQRSSFVYPWLFRVLVTSCRIDPKVMVHHLQTTEYEWIITTHDLFDPNEPYDDYVFGLPPEVASEKPTR